MNLLRDNKGWRDLNDLYTIVLNEKVYYWNISKFIDCMKKEFFDLQLLTSLEIYFYDNLIHGRLGVYAWELNHMIYLLD